MISVIFQHPFNITQNIASSKAVRDNWKMLKSISSGNCFEISRANHAINYL